MGSTRAGGERPEQAGSAPGSTSDPAGPLDAAPGEPDSADEDGGQPESRERRLATLANQLWISGIIGGYAVAFWVGIRDLDAQAATYPRVVIGLLLTFVLLGVVHDLILWRRGQLRIEADDEFPVEERGEAVGAIGAWRKWHKTILTFLLAAGFVWSIPRVGFYESAVFFLTLLFFLLGIRRPLILVPLVAGVMLASWLLFAVALNVRIPTGPLIG